MNLTVQKVLDAEECALLRDTFDRNVHLSDERDFSGQPVLRQKHIWNAYTDGAIMKAADRSVAAGLALAQRPFHPMPPLLWVETVMMTRMGEGGWHMPHADNETLVGDRWVPNHTPHRTHAAIIYLSEDFAGGALFFRDSGVTVRPRAGMMVVFPADRHHVHEVTPVRSGLRYSLAIWLTDRIEEAEKLGG